MRGRDFALLMLVCIIWAYSNVLSKIVVSDWQVPPLLFAAARFAVVAVVTLPWLFPIPKFPIRILTIGLLMGAGNFALLFMGLQTVSPSFAAIVIQINVPITTSLAVILLGERVHPRRLAGIALTLAGVVLVVWKPGGIVMTWGLVFIVASAFAMSLGSVLMKQVDDMAPLRFQAFTGCVSVLPLAIGSAALEQHRWSFAIASGWHFLAAVAFAALVVSVFAHTAFYWLIQKYEANLLAPLTLLNPLLTCVLGALLTGDTFDGRMVGGALLALIGVLVVALQRSPNARRSLANAAEDIGVSV